MESKGVSSLLHSLRGEQFRHTRNLERAKRNLSKANSTDRSSTTTVPFTLDYSELHGDQRPIRAGTSQAAPSHPTTAGPVPKSWRKVSQSDRLGTDADEPAWRAEALSVVLNHLPDGTGLTSRVLRDTLPGLSSIRSSPSSAVPPLSALCFRVILSLYTGLSDFEEELVPYLAPHLRRDLLRYTSIYSPLPNSKLYALCEEGHADGELIIIGPHSSLRNDLWNDSGQDTVPIEPGDTDQEEEEDWSWDSPFPSSSPLLSLTLLSTPLTIPTLLTVPPTLTHLALLAIPSLVPIQHLPSICPLLVVLDLSYNKWIDKGGVGEKALRRVEWRRLRRLEVLGLRGCAVDTEDLREVNRERWEDVRVILDS
ncbi:hypothetical protein NEOLEDRAFT_1177474 [Neolentinus lepideus HHB14362 ss-1]|uniref:Uncharacterized protein n=1 Tax=Neolentinus lepideus HHB14362 ss-1 TaxID=1314782 RepID=A0A165TCN2_9AGAM|nr:hypothetical protein NEOLEDRAFT_1177474 [Neolentinus lepideus HHB14362 ss-1]